jgi:16S rRNA G1207 methylase RsmC
VNWQEHFWIEVSLSDGSRRFISELELKGSEHILDLGSGDGVLTAHLASLVPQGRVVGNRRRFCGAR